MKNVYILSFDEAQDIRACLNDIISRLSKDENLNKSYGLRHALESAKDIERIFNEEEEKL